MTQRASLVGLVVLSLFFINCCNAVDMLSPGSNWVRLYTSELRGYLAYTVQGAIDEVPANYDDSSLTWKLAVMGTAYNQMDEDDWDLLLSHTPSGQINVVFNLTYTPADNLGNPATAFITTYGQIVEMTGSTDPNEEHTVNLVPLADQSHPLAQFNLNLYENYLGSGNIAVDFAQPYHISTISDNVWNWHLHGGYTSNCQMTKDLAIWVLELVPTYAPSQGSTTPGGGPIALDWDIQPSTQISAWTPAGFYGPLWLYSGSCFYGSQNNNWTATCENDSIDFSRITPWWVRIEAPSSFTGSVLASFGGEYKSSLSLMGPYLEYDPTLNQVNLPTVPANWGDVYNYEFDWLLEFGYTNGTVFALKNVRQNQYLPPVVNSYSLNNDSSLVWQFTDVDPRSVLCSKAFFYGWDCAADRFSYTDVCSLCDVPGKPANPNGEPDWCSSSNSTCQSALLMMKQCCTYDELPLASVDEVAAAYVTCGVDITKLCSQLLFTDNGGRAYLDLGSKRTCLDNTILSGSVTKVWEPEAYIYSICTYRTNWGECAYDLPDVS